MNAISIKVLLLFVVIATLTYRVQGQSYHFSNGWNPGKRSSIQDICRFRPEMKSLVFKLIEEEVLRMLTDPTCYGDLPSQRSLLKKDIGYPPMEDRK